MAASDHLAPKLFHGTDAYLSPGDTVNPGKWDSSYPESPGAYATSNFEHAQTFSRVKAEGTGVLFSPVYEVEHLTEHSDPEGRMGNKVKNFGYARDPKGFRVVKHAGWANQDFNSPHYNTKPDDSIELDVL